MKGGGCTYVVVEGGPGVCPRENILEKEAFMCILEQIAKYFESKISDKALFLLQHAQCQF